MKIAREIVETAERRHGCALYDNANVITATGEEWEEIIAANLAPVREALGDAISELEHMGKGTNCEYPPDDTIISECRASLALLSDED